MRGYFHIRVKDGRFHFPADARPGFVIKTCNDGRSNLRLTKPLYMRGLA